MEPPPLLCLAYPTTLPLHCPPRPKHCFSVWAVVWAVYSRCVIASHEAFSTELERSLATMPPMLRHDRKSVFYKRAEGTSEVRAPEGSTTWLMLSLLGFSQTARMEAQQQL